jgi:hypothetical protein
MENSVACKHVLLRHHRAALFDIGTRKHSGAPAACVDRGLEFMMQTAYARL